MSQEFRGINDFYFVKKNTQEKEAQPVDTEEESAAQDKESPEVKLIEGKWLPGDEGFQFNKKCIAQIKAEFLKETNRKKVTIDTFVEFDGEEEDLGQQVEAFLDDECVGEAEVTLFYGEKYSDAIRENPGATCTYKFIAHHSACEKDVESALLEMPAGNKVNFRITIQIDPDDEDSQDDTIKLFSTDDAKTYDSTLTIKDDKVPGDNKLTLEFTELDENLAYTLEVNPGNEGNLYYLFENKTLEEIANG